MQRGEVAWKFATDLAHYGLMAAPIAAFVGWQIVFPLTLHVSMVVFMFFFAPMGAATGCVSGLIAAVVTMMFFQWISNPTIYLVAHVITVCVAAFLVAFCVISALLVLFSVGESAAFGRVSVLGGVLAAISAVYPAYRVGQRYLRDGTMPSPVDVEAGY